MVEWSGSTRNSLRNYLEFGVCQRVHINVYSLTGGNSHFELICCHAKGDGNSSECLIQIVVMHTWWLNTKGCSQIRIITVQYNDQKDRIIGYLHIKCGQFFRMRTIDYEGKSVFRDSVLRKYFNEQSDSYCLETNSMSFLSWTANPKLHLESVNTLPITLSRTVKSTVDKISLSRRFADSSFDRPTMFLGLPCDVIKVCSFWNPKAD